MICLKMPILFRHVLEYLWHMLKSRHNSVRKMHKKNIFNKETSTNIRYFASFLKGKTISSKLGATHKGKNLLVDKANSFLLE